jgi:regulator of sigma E protease
MSIIIFLIILAIIVFVHELGHFLVAKRSGMRVDRFAIGFPPKLWSFKKGETEYAINLIPFGGFVSIFGENPDEQSEIPNPDLSRSFGHKSKWSQVAVLLAGIFANILFAWLLLTISYVGGLPTPVAVSPQPLTDIHLVITSVAAHSPAEKAGLKAGDTVLGVSTSGAHPVILSPIETKTFQDFIAAHGSDNLAITYERAGQAGTLAMMPANGIVPDRAAIGVSLDMIGLLKLSPGAALLESSRETLSMLKGTVVGLSALLVNAVRGQAKLSEVTGPVGIVGLVGDAAHFGFTYLLSFAAFISLNLAVINLIPFPALDGGRVLFVIIEAIKGSPIKPKIANAFNLIGFSLLMLLMLVVTYHDIARIVLKQ